LLVGALLSGGLFRVVFISNVTSAYAPMATVSLDPALIWEVMPPGTEFQIDMAVYDVWYLYSYEFKLFYESLPLNATGIIEGSFLSGAGGGPTVFNVIQMNREYNATHGIIWVNSTLIDPQGTASGSGVMATLDFEVIDYGGSPMSLDDMLYDASGNPIPHITTDGDVTVLGGTTSTKTFNVAWSEGTYTVATTSNSTVAKLNFTQPQRRIDFYVNGIQETNGFCNVTIPNALLSDNASQPWVVYVDDIPVNVIISSNQTHSFIYFTYHHSTSHIEIEGAEVVSEFPPNLILPLFMTLTLLAAAIAKNFASTKAKQLKTTNRQTTSASPFRQPLNLWKASRRRRKALSPFFS